jgi:hypothetical protein
MGYLSRDSVGAIDTWQDGFKLAGAGKYGQCISYDGSSVVQDGAFDSDPVVYFEKDLSYQCQIQMNLPELDQFCGRQVEFI